MDVMLKSTTKITTLLLSGVEVPARIWEGVSANGTPCHAYIIRIAADKSGDNAEFMRDLQEHAAPSADIQAIPLRMIL